MAGRMPFTSPFFHHNYNGFHNGMINHNLLRSSHHIADPRFGMVNTLPFRAGHPIAPTMGHIMGHPFHALPPQPYTSAHNMVPIATAVHDPTYVSKNGEVEHVVKGIHAETAIKNIHGVTMTKREAEPMEVKVDGVHARTALNTMPIMTGMISPTMGHSGFPMTYGTGIVNNMPFRTSHIPPTMAHMPCGPSGCVAHNIAPTNGGPPPLMAHGHHIAPTMAHNIAPTMTPSMLHPFHTGQHMVRTIAPNTHFGFANAGLHRINTGIHGFNPAIWP